MLKCCVATMAYNEEANISQMMKAILSQQLHQVKIVEIIVIASGCTDRTEEIVESFVKKDGRVRLVTQSHRSGKSSAVNLMLRQTKQDIIVLVNADTVPDSNAIEELVIAFKDTNVGMTAGRPVPINDPHSFMGFTAHLLWTLHHQISLRCPKMGEMIAFRNFFHQIPDDSAVDEASIEPLIRGQGFQLHYVPEAIVHNRGPETVNDFLRQRRRIYAGHVYVRDMLGYRVSTMKSSRILWLLLRNPGIKRGWRYFLWGPIIVALEALARVLGALDYHIWKRKHAVWDVVQTTKATISAPVWEEISNSSRSH